MIFVNHSKQQIKTRSYHYNSPRVYDINTYTGNNAVVVPENFRTEETYPRVTINDVLISIKTLEASED